MLKTALCFNTFHRILYILFFRQRLSSLLLCYLSCAWSWEWHRAGSFGRRFCAVDHDSVRVWLCTSLQNKLYLFPLPVSQILEGAPNPPTKALQESRSGCGGGRQLWDGKRHKKRGRSRWLFFSYMETTLIILFITPQRIVLLWSKSCTYFLLSDPGLQSLQYNP